jgi:hypothetical protein
MRLDGADEFHLSGVTSVLGAYPNFPRQDVIRGEHGSRRSGV